MRKRRADPSRYARISMWPRHPFFSALVLLLSLSPRMLAFAGTDTTPPSLRIVEPATGTEIGSDTLTVEIEYRDTESGIAADKLRVLLDGKDYAGQFDQHNRGASGQLRLPKALPLGDNKLTVEISDRAGNVARADSVFFYGGPPEASYNAGLAHAQAGRWKEAATSFGKAVVFDPKHADAYLQLGHAYQKLQRHSDAVTAYQQAARLRPNDLETFQSLGDALVRLKNFGEAAAAYRHATDIAPNNADAFKSLGIAYRADNKYPEAKHALEKARRLNPQDADIYAQTGLVHLAQKHYLLAEMNFRRAVLVNPKSTSAYVGLGEAYLEQARYDKAVEAFSEAVEITPKSAKARFGLGMAYIGLKDRVRAQEQIPFLSEANKDLSDELRRRIKE